MHTPPGRLDRGCTLPLMAMVEVTNRCNLSCPLCFSGAADHAGDVSLERIRQRLEKLLHATDGPIPLQISGGEPTVRKNLGEVIDLARQMGFVHIELITNGIRIAREPHLLEKWKMLGLKAIYLQFDGLAAATHVALRGRDLRHIRIQAIEAARQAGLCCTLACSISPGINDHEIGAIIDFAWTHIDTVRAINFQAATPFPGRFNLARPVRGLKLNELLHLIESQSGLPASTFYGEPLGHPACNAISYVFDVNGARKPLFAYLTRKDIAKLLAGRRRDVILGLFSGKQYFFDHFLTNPRSWKIIAKCAPLFGSNPLNMLRAKHLLIFAKSFIQPGDEAADRLRQCCYGIAADTGVHSFCDYNHHHRFGDAPNGRKRIGQDAP